MRNFLLEWTMGSVGFQSRGTIICQFSLHLVDRCYVCSSDKLYLPGTTFCFQLQAQGSSTFEPLAATVVKRFEFFAVVLLVQQHSDHENISLKLTDYRLGYRSNKEQLDTVPWTSSIDDHLRRAVHDIQAGAIPDWFEVISDFDNRPDTEPWEDWM
ncbi:uncharacterized protein ARMOST_15904 [Armillaria ostoyae]|uniref:Uncharacterized protein n=1 Tax=Armillaria ostoyae TaxID=47428 RepID=A0A284RUQ5_ARMOS|nr:uncharacterized protein ARMOST_15904 [Armillaria ostoyae]